MKTTLQILTISLVLFASCSKTKDTSSNPSGCTKPATPTAGATNNLNTGDVLNLTATSVANASYKWSGPGFTSTDQNPIISNVVPGMSGKYAVKATVNGCVSDSSTVAVSIYSMPLPCTIPVNSVTITPSSTGTPVSTSLIPYCLQTALDYQMTAQDNAGAYGIVLHFLTAPTQTAIYQTSDLSSPGKFGVYIAIQTTANNRNYHSAKGGFVFVTVSGGTVNASFCNVTMDNPAYLNDHLAVTTSMNCQ